MIQRQLKLKLRPGQERQLERWLWHLTGVYNWAVLKVQHDADDGVYHSRYDLEALIAGHSRKVGIPSKVLEPTVRTAHDAWQRCFKGLAKRPRLKGRRNRLNSIPFRYRLASPSGRRIKLRGIGAVKFHRQDIPAGTIKCARVIKRASGWYCCLVIDAEPNSIPEMGHGEIGIDPGFLSLLTLSTGEKIEHPRELRRTAGRLAQAQRGQNRRLTARLKERESNQRRDRNHKLSRRLISENALIAWSADSHRSIARRFGKSVASAAHGQLREMIAGKCRTGGRRFVAVSSRYSTVTCAACQSRSGPSGFAGLSVRRWVCSGCGSSNDRDVNAAINTLIAGRGVRLEGAREGVSEIVNYATRQDSMTPA